MNNLYYFILLLLQINANRFDHLCTQEALKVFILRRKSSYEKVINRFVTYFYPQIAQRIFYQHFLTDESFHILIKTL